MRYASALYIIVAGIAIIIGKEHENLVAVGAPEPWLLLVQDTLQQGIDYVTGLVAVGILALPHLPALANRLLGKDPAA